eukprot:scpid16363/ scgid32282/ 
MSGPTASATAVISHDVRGVGAKSVTDNASPATYASNVFHHSKRRSYKTAGHVSPDEESVKFRQVIRSILHPVGCVIADHTFDRQQLFNHAVKCLGVDGKRASQELSRVNREPPPTFVLHARVLKVLTDGDQVLDGNVRVRFRVGDHDTVHSAKTALSGRLDCISENEELYESSVRKTHRVSVGEQCALSIGDPLNDEIRIDITHQDGTDGMVNGHGRCFTPIHTLSTLGSTLSYEVLDVESKLPLWTALIQFQFEARELVIDIGHHFSDTDDNQSVFLGVCHQFALSQLSDIAKSNPSQAPAACAVPTLPSTVGISDLELGFLSTMDGGDGYEEDGKQGAARVHVTRDVSISADTQIILDGLAMQQQITELAARSYLTEAVFACTFQHAVDWLALTYNLRQLDRQFSHLRQAYGGGILPASETCAVQQCLLSIYNILLRKVSERHVLFPPARRSAELDSVVKPLSVIDILFSTSMWQYLVLKSDDALGINVQLHQLLQSSARTWYSSNVVVRALSDDGAEEVIPVCQAFLACLKVIQDSYERSVPSYVMAFEKLGIDYWKTSLTSLEELVHDDLQILAQTSCEMLVQVNSSVKRNAARVETCYELCRALFQLVESGIRLSPTDTDGVDGVDNRSQRAIATASTSLVHDKTRVHRLHMVLEVLIPHWLQTVDVYCKQSITEAIDRDKVNSISDTEHGISSCAAEFGSMVELLASHWESAIDWPEPVVSYLIITRLMDIICECSRRVASHCHRCIRNWPPSRLFSGRVDYMQPILAANNVAFVAMRLRAVPRELRLLGFQEDFSGVHFTSPSPRALSPRAHSPCHPQRRSYGDIQAAAVITMVTAATPAADQPSDPLSKSMPSPRRSLELPDVVPPAVKQFRNEGKSSDSGGGGSVQRSRSFKERKSPMSSLGVSSSPVVVRRTGSLRRSRKKGDRNSGDAGARGEENGSGLRRSHRPLSCSSPDLLLFVNGRPGDSGSAASDETVGTQRQRAAARLVIDNCMRDLSTVLMQIGQQVVTKFAIGVDIPLLQVLSDLPEANSDMDIGVVIAPLLDYITGTVKSVMLEGKITKLAQEGLVRGLWNVINIRLYALLSTDSSSTEINHKLLSNSLAALTMNEGVMSFFCRELGFSIRRSMLHTSAFLALKHFIEVKTTSDDGLLLLFFSNIANETVLTTGARVHVNLELSLSDQPCVRLTVKRGEQFDRLKSSNVELESYVECSLLPMSLRLGGQELETYTSVAVAGETPHFNAMFNIPFRKGMLMKQRLLQESVLVICVKVYSGVTTMSGSEEFYHNAGVAVFKISTVAHEGVGAASSNYSCKLALPVLRVTRQASAYEFVTELEKRARLSQEGANIWRTWLPALRPI